MESRIPEALLEVLACPACDSRPRVQATDYGLRCPACGRTYPVENGIPIMLVDKASGGGEQAK